MEETKRKSTPESSIIIEETEEQIATKQRLTLEAPVKKQKQTKKFMTLTGNKMVAIKLISD